MTETIVFGATGYIGGHVAEQLVAAGQRVTAVARRGADTGFLRDAGARVVDFPGEDRDSLSQLIAGHETVHNCIAHRGGDQIPARDVNVRLSARIAEAAAAARVRRFVQLSTIMVYGFDMRADPADETTPCNPVYEPQVIALERERALLEVARRTGLELVLLRPASTIGPRDRASFFSQFWQAAGAGRYPLVGDGSARVSLLDTRDAGRAMAWVADERVPPGVYLARAFELSWLELKEALDRERGEVSGAKRIPRALAYPLASVMERVSKQPPLTRFIAKNLTEPRVWDDTKLRATGFSTLYGASEAIALAAADLRVAFPAPALAAV